MLFSINKTLSLFPHCSLFLSNNQPGMYCIIIPYQFGKIVVDHMAMNIIVSGRVKYCSCICESRGGWNRSRELEKC